MYYSELVKLASIISFKAHKHDYDKAGYPYFMHPQTAQLSFTSSHIWHHKNDPIFDNYT